MGSSPLDSWHMLFTGRSDQKKPTLGFISIACFMLFKAKLDFRLYQIFTISDLHHISDYMYL